MPFPGLVTCTIGTVPSGATRTITIVVTAPSNPGPATSLTNTAVVGATTPDPNPGNNLTTLTTPMIRRTDLSITKVPTTSPGVAGQNLGYTLTVANSGPSAEYGVVATDFLPFGVGFAGASASQGSCGASAGIVTCNLGTLDAGGVVTINIVVAIPSGFTGVSVTNNANVGPTGSTPTRPTTPHRSRSRSSISPTCRSRRRGAPDPVVAGGTLTYTLTVANAGPSDAIGVQVNDTLPPGVTFVAAPGCTFSGPSSVACPIGALASGATAVRTVTVTVDPSALDGSLLTNTAFVDGIYNDPNLGNNFALASTNVARVADLQLTKTESVDPVVAGQQLTYTLAVHNNGPSNASGVVITDALPPLVTFSSASPGCTETTGVVTCNVGVIAAGATASASITVDVPAATPAGTVIANHADATGTELDPNPADNGADATTTVARLADVWITKSAGPDPVDAGSALTYHLTATNNGPSNAAAVSITDVLPPGTTFVSASTGCTETAGTVQCDFGEVAFQATVDATVTVIVDPSVPDGSVLTNTATAQSDDPDPQPANNTATATTDVDAVADLALTKTATPDPAVGGQNVTYTLTVTNQGPSDALAVAVADTLPAGTTLVSIAPEQGSCSPAAGTITCNVGTVAALDTVSIDVVVTVDAGVLGQLDNTATVSSPTTDPSPANNTATASVDVTAAADLSLAKTLEAAPLVPGTDAAYVLTVHNAGPSDATAVTVTDTLPAPLTYVSATGGTCSGAGPLTCDLGTIASGATKVLRIVVAVDPAATGSIANTATVTSASGDPDLSNNTEHRDRADPTAVRRAPHEDREPGALPGGRPGHVRDHGDERRAVDRSRRAHHRSAPGNDRAPRRGRARRVARPHPARVTSTRSPTSGPARP